MKTLHFCEKVFTKAKSCFPDTQQTICRNPTNLSLLMSVLCSFLCFKLYSLKFVFAHAQKRLLCLSEMVIITLHKNTRKLTNHVKQAQKSKCAKKISKLSPFDKKKTKKKKQSGNIECLVIFNLSRIFDNFLLPNQVDLSAHYFYHF